MFNTLPTEINSLYSNFERFKVVLKHFFIINSFYTVDEYLNR
jgi:hypothetical protein